MSSHEETATLVCFRWIFSTCKGLVEGWREPPATRRCCRKASARCPCLWATVSTGNRKDCSWYVSFQEPQTVFSSPLVCRAQGWPQPITRLHLNALSHTIEPYALCHCIHKSSPCSSRRSFSCIFLSFREKVFGGCTGDFKYGFGSDFFKPFM